MARIRRIMLLAMVVIAMGAVGTVSADDGVPRMSVDELKAILDSPDLLLLDVRQPGDWASDEMKIKGAVRMDPTDFGGWKDKLPQGKTIVLYCA